MLQCLQWMAADNDGRNLQPGLGLRLLLLYSSPSFCICLTVQKKQRHLMACLPVIVFLTRWIEARNAPLLSFRASEVIHCTFRSTFEGCAEG